MDFRLALRMLRNSPGFAIAAIATLALATGANIAIFSVVNGILLRPLPYREPDRLVRLWDVPPGGGTFAIAPANFLDWQAHANTLELAALNGTAFNLTGNGEPVRLKGLRASANMLSMMGIPPIQGRVFTPEEDDPGHSHVVVIGYGLWKDRFAGDYVAGKTIQLNSEPYTIVGVMPAGFQSNVDVWAPMPINPSDRAKRGMHGLGAIARLRPGATLAQARAEMKAIAAGLAQAYPDNDKDWSVEVTPLADTIIGEIKTPLWVLAGAAGLVLLIGCANVANLLLARATARRKEFSIRAALGAGQMRIARQLLCEGLMLAVLGAGAGLALAAALVRMLAAMAPANVPRIDEVAVDWQSLLFSVAIVAATVFIFALAPAIRGSKADPQACLKEGGRAGQGEGHRQIRRLLVVAETALAMLLLIGAGLLLKSFERLQDVELGFDPHNVLTMSVSLPRARYPTPAQRGVFFHQLADRMAQLPGVESASVVGDLPFRLDTIFTLYKPGHTGEDDGFQVNYYNVSEKYFDVMRIPLKRGRYFNEHDTAASTKVMILNETAAEKLFPGEDAIGKRVHITYEPGFPVREIVGIVGDTKQYGRDSKTTRQAYEPAWQRPWNAMAIAVRTSGDPLRMSNAVRAQVLAIDAEQPVAEVRTMEDIVNLSVGDRRFSVLLMTIFGSLAMVLAAVGTYSVLAYTVSQRTQEIGIRMAIGARTANILRLVAGEGVVLAGIGVAIGTAGALVLSRVLEKQLFQVKPADPAVFLGVIALLMAAAILASVIPAMRAASIDPMRALRDE